MRASSGRSRVHPCRQEHPSQGSGDRSASPRGDDPPDPVRQLSGGRVPAREGHRDVRIVAQQVARDDGQILPGLRCLAGALDQEPSWGLAFLLRAHAPALRVVERAVHHLAGGLADHLGQTAPGGNGRGPRPCCPGGAETDEASLDDGMRSISASLGLDTLSCFEKFARLSGEEGEPGPPPRLRHHLARHQEGHGLLRDSSRARRSGSLRRQRRSFFRISSARACQSSRPSVEFRISSTITGTCSCSKW